jgi:hypothetical protein
MLSVLGRRRAALLACALTATLGAAAYAATSRPVENREPVATVDRVQGDTSVDRDGLTTPLKGGEPLIRYDRIKTGAGARLSMTFNDGSTLLLGENTHISIDQFLPEQGRKSGALILDMLYGAFRLTSKEPVQAPDKRVQVRTSTAFIAARAADFWSGGIDGKFGVMLLGGSINVRNDAGSVVLDRRRHGTLIADRSIAPDQVTTWPTEKSNRALRTVAFK